MLRALAALVIVVGGACENERPRERKVERTREWDARPAGPAEAPTPTVDAEPFPALAITGSSACNDWLTRATCVIGAASVAPDVRQAFVTVAEMLKDMIADPATRQDAVDTCKQMLAATQQDFESMGCGDAESHAP